MEKSISKHWLLFGIVLLIGIFVRFVGLGEVPVGFHRDEAFLGYNSYSIASTGKDMNGNFLPLHLESFIYSPAGYSYISAPFIKIFDLSPLSVRFASAFFGSLTIFITFLLTKLLFEKYRYRNSLAIISSLMLALSPWHINLSRTATENTLVVFFVSLGTLLFLSFIKRTNYVVLFLSFVSFGLTLLIYQAPRAFLPLFIPLLILSFMKIKIYRRKFIPIVFLYIIFILAPLLMILSSPELSLRIKTLNIFDHPQTQLTIDENLREDGISNTPILVSRIFHNKIVNYSSLFLDNYFKHFSFDFLFTDKGFPDRYRVPSNGLLHLIELPLILFGTWFILRTHRKVGICLIGWVALSPIGSALTFDDIPNLQRSMLVFPALSIISAFGLLNLYLVLRRYKYSTFLIIILSLVSAYSVFFYLHQYWVHQIVHRPWYRQEGYKELVGKVNEILPSYSKAVITNRESAPSIFFLFFSKYDPQTFQNETKNINTEHSDSVNFNKYIFTDEECPLKIDVRNAKQILTGEKDALYVNSGLCTLPKVAQIIKTIKRADNSVVFYLLKVE